ncbi:hypothetical protein IID19_03530, partial [Patescibacteria group bacterium]|nr:hypothetical protein [Patescibacteria group bacterium]
VSGAGTLRFTDASGGPGSTLSTLSSIVRFDASAGNIASTTLDARTYSGQVEFFSSSATARTVTFATGIYTLSGASSHLYVIADGASGGDVTLIGATNNPTVTIGGDLDFRGTGASSEIITSGTGIWTVSGNVVFTDGTYTATAGNTLNMNGASKNITSASQVLQNFGVTGGDVTNIDALDINGTFDTSSGGRLIQGANVNINVAGNFTLASGTNFAKATGTGLLIFDGDLIFTDNTAVKQDMGSVEIGTSPDTTDLASDFSATNLKINDGDIFNSNGYEVDLSNKFDCVLACTFNLDDDVETDGTIVTVGGNWTMSGTGSFTTTNSLVEFDGANNQTVDTGDLAFNNFKVNNSGSPNDNVIISGNLNVDGDLFVDDGEFEMTTNNPTVNVAGSVTFLSAATVTKGTGTWTFDGTTAETYTDSTATPQNIGTVVFNKTSGGAGDKVTLASDMTVDTADIQTSDTLDLAGSGYTLTLANAGATATVLTVTGTLTPGTSTVKYSATNSAGNINIVTTPYSSLQFSGTETYVLTGNLTGGNGLTGGMTIDSGAILDTTGSNYNIDLAGDWTSNGDFTDNSSTVTLDGTSTQTLSGQMTGASDRFYNLTITNAGASNPDVDFAAAAEVANNFVANTANTQIEFNVSSTYTFQNIDFDGQATGTRVVLRSSSTGTQWNIDVAGTRVVLNSDVQDSNACGQAPDIDATGGTNKNSTNNTCWIFKALTVSLSLNSLNLGTLSTTQVNQDGITLTVSTDAANGYSSQVMYDNTLTSPGSDTISDTVGGTIVVGTEEFGASSEKSGYDIGVWSPTSCADTGSTSNATALTTSLQTFAGDSAPVSSDTTVLCFLASITGTTEAGGYTNVITIVTTGLF